MAKVVEDLLLGTELLHDHTPEYDDRYANIFVDTRANILALTPTAKQIAYATDVERFYVADGTNWFNAPIPFGKPSTGTDMGAIPFDDDHGYGIKDLTGKYLHNIVLKWFSTPVEDGALRNDRDTFKLQTYQNGEWKTLRALTDDDIDDIVLWSKFDLAEDGNGNPVLHHHKIDMGAMATQHLFNGGTF